MNPAKPANTDWNAVALAKLTNVLGQDAGRAVMAEVLASVELPSLHSPEELRRFGEALASRGGFAGAIGGMLTLHATLYGRAKTV